MTLEAPAAPIIRRLVAGSVRAGVEDLGGTSAMVARSISDLRRGALSPDDGDTLAEAASVAATLRIPFVLVLSSSGADVSGGVASLHSWGQAARALASCSGLVPVVIVVTGPGVVRSGPTPRTGRCRDHDR